VYDKPLGVNDKIIVNDIKLDIVGIFDEIGNPSDDAIVYMDEDTFLDVTNDSKNYAMITARIDDLDRTDEIIDRAEKNLRQHRNQDEGKEDFFIQSFEELLEAFQNSLNFIIGFIIFIAFVSVVISAINTANTMFTSILERTKEIGVLKSIGARNSEILKIFLLESSILGFVAGIIGASLGALISWLAGVLLAAVGFGFLQPHLSWLLFGLCILFATVVGMISGMIPAYNASKQKPVDSLRYE
jgi:putative ABC transport system permease protein